MSQLAAGVDTHCNPLRVAIGSVQQLAVEQAPIKASDSPSSLDELIGFFVRRWHEWFTCTADDWHKLLHGELLQYLTSLQT
jgi:hypothetical protein